MRTIVLAVLAALGAALLGGLLGWGMWAVRGRPHSADPPSLALVQPAPPNPAAPEPGRRLRPDPGLRNNPRRGGAARLALVIDDIGHNLGAPREFLALGVPLTFSILPDLPYTRAAAELILRARRDYIIHMPMEPADYPDQDPGPNPLLLRLDLPETQRRLLAYLAELPGAIGASNHMGSAYTGDEARMALVQGELARHRLIFLNSKTSATPVPAHVAAQGGYRYLERDVFLDNVREERAIGRELRHALRRAERRGHAIAIGHPYGETLAALADALARGELQGVELVSLSELARP
jgi:hypothetical protein